MNKQLLILRHAKSDWDVPYARDFDRPLNKRGKNDAKRIANWMLHENLQPDYILCSPAIRARNTLEPITHTFKTTGIQTEYPGTLYLADFTTLLSAIKSIPETIQCLLLVGHNPGLEELVDYLSVQPVPLTSNGKMFTTANLALFELPEGFSNLEKNSALLNALIRPAEISI